MDNCCLTLELTISRRDQQGYYYQRGQSSNQENRHHHQRGFTKGFHRFSGNSDNGNLHHNPNNSSANAAEEANAIYSAKSCKTRPVSTNFIIDSRANNHFAQKNLELYMFNIKILTRLYRYRKW